MADKKITELTAAPEVKQSDLFVVVVNPSSTPITKKVTASILFNSVSYIVSSDTTDNVISLNAVTTANTANVTGDVVGAKISLVVANGAISRMGSGAGGSGFYGLSVEHSNTVTRANASSAPHAFINMQESVTTAALSTKYLLDVGRNGSKNVSSNATAGNTDVMLVTGSFANTTIGGKLKVRVNGADYWIMLSANAS